MPINADKPHLWKQDILQSVDLFNRWFMKFAPKAFRDTRIRVTKQVEEALLLTNDLRGLSPALIQNHPRILPTLRMCTCPPLTRDRLIGLSGAGKALVGTLEAGSIPPRMPSTLLAENLARIVRIISRMLDKDILPWIGGRLLVRLAWFAIENQRRLAKMFPQQVDCSQHTGSFRQLPCQATFSWEVEQGHADQDE